MNLTDNWLFRLREAAKTNEGRENFGQLSSLVEFFNRKSTHTSLEQIEWSEWRDQVKTPGVVDKIKEKYGEFMS